MKYPLSAVLMALWAALSQAQSPHSSPVIAEQSRSHPVVMERAEQWTMRSKAARIYEISIARPNAAAPTHGYPVMFVLDPSTAFATLVDTVRNQEQMFGPAVVVGVGYARDAEERESHLGPDAAHGPGQSAGGNAQRLGRYRRQ